MSTEKRRGKQRITPLTKQSGIGEIVLLYMSRCRKGFGLLALRRVNEKLAFVLEIFLHDEPS